MPIQMAFGQQDKQRSYVMRPSAYALLLNEQGLIAVVKTPHGSFLPGGGIEKGEKPGEAVLREILEETGHDAHLLWELAEADQYVNSQRKFKGYLKRSHFYLAELDAREDAQPEFPVLWLAPNEAHNLLLYDSHKWVIKRFEPYLKA